MILKLCKDLRELVHYVAFVQPAFGHTLRPG
uniref:Uncharacterized protein n=1 Tax=mine drainage metagenome TaxID=410659 RepID=E6PCL8_9ZZZZ